MIRSIPARLTRLLAWGCALVLLTLAAPAVPARAEGPSVRVELAAVRITGSGAKTTVILRGSVTNDGAQPAFGVHVVLWRSRDAITDPAVFRQVASGANQPWGERLDRTTDHFYKVTTSTESLDPGKSHEFVVRATLSELGFAVTGAAYAFGVQVLGTPDASSNYTVIGRARTFLAVPPKRSLPLTSMVLLSSAPSKLHDNLFVDDHLADELTGRLAELLAAAERPGASYLIDPALYDELVDLVDGYQVTDGRQIRPGTGQQLAAQWLARFSLLPTSRGARTLFANPDVLGAARAGDASVLQRALAATAAVSELDGLPLVVVPAGGIADAALVEYLQPAGAAAILVATGGTGPVLSDGPGRTALIRLAPAVAAAGPGSENGPVQRVQRQLAEALLGGGAARLLTDQTEIAADTAAAPRWLAREGIGALLGRPAPKPAAALTLPSEVHTLPLDRFREIHALAGDYGLYADVVPGSAVAADAPATLTRAAAGAWLGEADGRGYLDLVGGSISRDALADKVRLNASSRVLMSSKRNVFPVSVTNGLAEPVRIKVVVEADNPQRLTVPPSAVVTVEPGQRVTMDLRPEATANGLVNVSAHLESESGRRIGPNTRITVEVTELGMIGWIIVIASGLVLVVATALRIRQVRRSLKEETP